MDKIKKCKNCDTGFNFETCPINSDREGFKVSKEAMHKYGLCFTMTEEEHDQAMMSILHRSNR